jgi:hypothetical protein
MHIQDNRTSEETILFKDLNIGDAYYTEDCDNFICIKLDDNRCLFKSICGTNWDIDHEDDNEIVYRMNVTLVINN